jgi:MFS transporter, MHS family, citrate/tricarballylate:H+ symporter
MRQPRAAVLRATTHMPGPIDDRGPIPVRYVAAVVLGNALEFYDFLTYSFFAVYIGRAFFPSSDPTTSLLASLGAFGVGFLTRPIGGLLIGRMGDRLGRKPAMVLCFAVMGVAIVGLALTPPQSMIGTAAPVLVIFFRMLQGLALGGEVGPTTAFLMEAAPLGRRGFYTAFQSWSQGVATLASGLAGFALSNLLSERQLQDYGWRIAFLLGAAIVPFGLMVRRALPETLHAAEAADGERISLRPYLSVAVLGLVLLANATISTYVRNYMTTYAIATLHMPAKIAFLATIVVGLTGVLFGPLGGALSDRFGRKPVMLIPGLIVLVLILPTYYVITRYRSTGALLASTAVLSSVASLSLPPIVTWLTESLPAGIRASGVAVVYAVSIAIFGGSTQYAVTWLTKVTGNPLAPAWYWTVAAVFGLAATIAARESAPHKVDREARRARVPRESLTSSPT